MSENKLFAITMGIICGAVGFIFLTQAAERAYEMKTLKDLADKGFVKDITITTR